MPQQPRQMPLPRLPPSASRQFVPAPVDHRAGAHGAKRIGGKDVRALSSASHVVAVSKANFGHLRERVVSSALSQESKSLSQDLSHKLKEERRVAGQNDLLNFGECQNAYD